MPLAGEQLLQPVILERKRDQPVHREPEDRRQHQQSWGRAGRRAPGGASRRRRRVAARPARLVAGRASWKGPTILVEDIGDLGARLVVASATDARSVKIETSMSGRTLAASTLAQLGEVGVKLAVLGGGVEHRQVGVVGVQVEQGGGVGDDPADGGHLGLVLGPGEQLHPVGQVLALGLGGDAQVRAPRNTGAVWPLVAGQREGGQVLLRLGVALLGVEDDAFLPAVGHDHGDVAWAKGLSCLSCPPACRPGSSSRPAS